VQGGGEGAAGSLGAGALRDSEEGLPGLDGNGGFPLDGGRGGAPGRVPAPEAPLRAGAQARGLRGARGDRQGAARVWPGGRRGDQGSLGVAAPRDRQGADGGGGARGARRVGGRGALGDERRGHQGVLQEARVREDGTLHGQAPSVVAGRDEREERHLDGLGAELQPARRAPGQQADSALAPSQVRAP